MTNKDEALKMALEMPFVTQEAKTRFRDEIKRICKEALEQPAQEKELMAIIESLQKHIKELKFEGARIEQPAKEPVAWMRSALDNARDVCKYLDHDMVKEAKAHTQFFWNDLDKIREFDNTHQQQMTGKDDD